MDKIDLKVKEYIINNNLLSDGDKVLLSLSAGPDSMTMLNIFLNLRQFFNISLVGFHLNHLMRGQESEDDELFLKELLKNNKIKLFCEKFDFINNKDPKLSFEEHARNIRYEFLSKLSEEEKCNKIATAHNYQDNTETLLMRIFTGTGLLGLTGINSKSDKIIRPLLELTVIEIYDYLKRNNLEWREDKSNQSNEHSRNYIRNIIMPGIKNKFPMFENSLSNLSKISSDTISLIDELLSNDLKGLYYYDNDLLYIYTEEICKNKKLFNYIIVKLLRQEFNFYCNSMIVNEIFKNFQQPKSNNRLYQNNEIIIEKIYKEEKIFIRIGRIDLKKNIDDWEYIINLNKTHNNLKLTEIGIEISLHFVDYEYFLENKKNNNYIFVTFDNKIDTITIRNRRQGDIISLNYGTKKIKDLLIEKKLDNMSKKSIPLLVVDSNIVAFMPGLLYNINNKTSKDSFVKKDSKKVLAIELKS